MKIYLYRLLLSLYFLFTTILLPLHAIAATDFKIIDLQHRFAEDIIPIIQPLAGSEGAVTGMQNHLIIRATPERMIEIEQVISTLDVARQNLKITVSHQNNLQTEREGVAVSGRKQIGNVDIGTNRYQKNVRDGVQLDIENSQHNTRSSSNQYINVIDGEAAFIRVGQSVPFTQEWVTLTRRYIRLQKTTEFIDISTGFSVRPRSIGDEIELQITPRIAQLNQRGYIDFEELNTTVRVKRGEWLNLGNIMQDKDEVSRAILSQQNSIQSRNNNLSIRVE
ncbi:secretin N-terminal domain-containing protein [Methylotenera sp.]|uniref:secretin N-terminal domain-containing protein n=1 Tax=Methylotenera sp. TaxID=2051956 RepID=UPI002718BC2D|nr:secretin N-terminal domain-containing protein [Methylotenera sp.]MDO9205253.1 secretin N-terminal domain-containing protein [Methylotenera sp.]MDP1521757.1 secretin N-terminal domain-containing protein [Methylotenera sp.]MDP2070783.1 secretin N-terminal domain-containing protein [Methylotenera sp.]MDP3004736.1 secretin N-terminal domain-containing protein [Methylotenera sp.]MDP3306952.1 secretin N-terminal domain-containing protein [Methylotenera sp.]